VRRSLSQVALDRSFGSLAFFVWVTAVGCATALQPLDVEDTGGEGGSSSGGVSGGESSGGVAPGTGGSTFLQGGFLGVGGAFVSGGAATASGGVSSSGGKSSGTAGGGTGSGGVTSAGAAGTPRGGSSAGGTGGASAKGGASNAGTSNGGASKGGANAGGSPAMGGASKGGSAGGTAKGELFFDDFETGADGWAQNPAGTDWAVVMDGSGVYKEQTRTGKQLLTAAGDSAWGDQIVEARLKILEFAGQSTSYYAAVCARVKDARNFYSVTLSSDGKLAIRRSLDGSFSKVGTLYTVPGGVLTNTWYSVRLEARGSVLTAYLNDTLATSYSVTSDLIATGGVGLATYNTIAVFDDVRVRTP
jgi:hypothetical protein